MEFLNLEKKLKKIEKRLKLLEIKMKTKEKIDVESEWKFCIFMSVFGLFLVSIPLLFLLNILK